MNEQQSIDYQRFAIAAVKTVNTTFEMMDREALEKAAALILKAKETRNRLHISGIGKPAHIAGYLASLMSSTGTPAYFLHGT